jgi:mycothiol S-conjugate amidase
MAQAQRILGVQHRWLGFVDSGLPQGDPLPPLPQGCFALEPTEVTTEALVRVVRDFRPHVMTTYDETGGYPHPDHVMCHTVAMSAFAAAGDPTAYQDCGQPWQPLKIYYIQTLTKARIMSYHDALEAAGLESPFAEWIPHLDGRGERTITTRVECADYFELRAQALLAHATQVDPDGTFFKVPMQMQKEVLPTEDYEAALSFVPIEPGESDLFAGLGTPEQATELATSTGLQIAYDGRRELSWER